MNLTPEAQERLERYLHKVRSAVRGSSASAQEVEQNVREHVAAALPSGSTAGVAELDAILLRLGDPSSWLSDDELPPWRRLVRRWSAGPDDWRLAYLSFAFTMLGLLTLPIGIGIVFLIGAFLISRSFVDAVGDEAVGARRWLVYPPIAIFLAIFTGVALIAPVVGLVGWLIDGGGYRFLFSSPMPWRLPADAISTTVGFAALIAGSWWLFLSGALALLARPLRFAFRPLLNGLRLRHIGALAIVGAVILALGLIALQF